jgi:hypothetical protein
MSKSVAPLAVLAAVPIALVLVLAGAVGLGSRTQSTQAGEGFSLMSAADLAKIVGQKDVAVFDANTDEVFAAARVPGAVHLADYREFPASVLPADKATRVIFYCKNTL